MVASCPSAAMRAERDIMVRSGRLSLTVEGNQSRGPASSCALDNCSSKRRILD